MLLFFYAFEILVQNYKVSYEKDNCADDHSMAKEVNIRSLYAMTSNMMLSYF